MKVLAPGYADVAGVAEDDVNLELVEVRAEQSELAPVVLDAAALDDVGVELGEALVELGREVAEEIRATSEEEVLVAGTKGVVLAVLVLRAAAVLEAGRRARRATPEGRAAPCGPRTPPTRGIRSRSRFALSKRWLLVGVVGARTGLAFGESGGRRAT